MLAIAGGLVLAVLGISVLGEILGAWTAQGRTVTSGLGYLVLWGVAAFGAVIIWALSSTQEQDRKWRFSQAAASRATWRTDSIQRHEAHAGWCKLWAGRAVADSVCDHWSVGPNPPAGLGAAARQHVARRLADSLSADQELALIDRRLGTGAIDAGDVFPEWNRWGRAHARADHFGRIRASRLVGEACTAPVPAPPDLDAELRHLKTQTDWCFRSSWQDSATFARAAP